MSGVSWGVTGTPTIEPIIGSALDLFYPGSAKGGTASFFTLLLYRPISHNNPKGSLSGLIPAGLVNRTPKPSNLKTSV
uniref:Uncharacterized protein n=1 Tax=Vibrio tasmaniensis TaxID=212663 RepID=A0A0H3ZW97_9VIBR|nr:hypothetical protein [Vibrio tasmaniensis]